LTSLAALALVLARGLSRDTRGCMAHCILIASTQPLVPPFWQPPRERFCGVLGDQKRRLDNEFV